MSDEGKKPDGRTLGEKVEDAPISLVIIANLDGEVDVQWKCPHDGAFELIGMFTRIVYANPQQFLGRLCASIDENKEKKKALREAAENSRGGFPWGGGGNNSGGGMQA